MSIYRLIYRSEATESLDVAQISGIIEDSAENNKILGLLGRWLDGKLQEKYGDQSGQVEFPLVEHKAFAFLYDVVAYLKDS